MTMNGSMQTLDGITPNKRLSGGGGGPTIPSDIAGLLFWYKTPISGATDGNPITTWPDSSSAGRDATAVGVNLIYRTNIINSLAVVDVGNDYAPFSSASLGTAHTVFIVIRPTGSFVDGVFIGGDANGKYTPYVDSTDLYYRAISSDGFVSVAHGGLSTNTPYLIEIVRSGTSVSFYKNALQLSTTQTLGANTALTVVQLFGTNGANFPPFGMQFAELFVYDSALSTSDRQAMESYISSRYAFF
jgi:hypothetical protein